MAKPYIMPATSDPIDIDPGVQYHYVVASSGATAFRVTPSPDFVTSFSAPLLKLKFVSKAPLLPTIYSLTFVASNATGNSSQTLNFRVSGKQISSIGTKFSCIGDGTTTIQLADGNNILRVGDAVFGNSVIYYIVAVGAGTFQMSLTPGGSAVVPAAASFYLYACTSSDASSDIWVGDTGGLVINAPISLAYDIATQALESALAGKLYLKSITDGYHIKVSATANGSAIAPSVVSYSRSNVLVIDKSGARSVPDITSAATASAPRNGPFAYSITSDIAVDSFAVEGLPAGLDFSAGMITGTAPDFHSTYAITLIATKDEDNASPARTYRRYFVLTVGAGGVLGRTAESIFTWRI